MKDYKRIIKKRMMFIGIGMVLSVIFVLTAGIWGYMQSVGSTAHLTDAMRGFGVGLFSGFILLMVMTLRMYAKALTSEAALKKLYIQENDERRKLIQDKIGGLGFNCMLGILAVSTTAAAFFNITVSVTLAVVLAVTAFMKSGLKIYYNRKY